MPAHQKSTAMKRLWINDGVEIKGFDEGKIFARRIYSFGGIWAMGVYVCYEQSKIDNKM
jgi:hypothetical protein